MLPLTSFSYVNLRPFVISLDPYGQCYGSGAFLPRDPGWEKIRISDPLHCLRYSEY